MTAQDLDELEQLQLRASEGSTEHHLAYLTRLEQLAPDLIALARLQLGVVLHVHQTPVASGGINSVTWTPDGRPRSE